MGLANSLLPAQRGALFLVLILLGLGSSQLTIAIQVHLRSRLIDVIRNPEAVIALERLADAYAHALVNCWQLKTSFLGL